MNNPFIAKNKKQQSQLDAIAKGLNVHPLLLIKQQQQHIILRNLNTLPLR